MPAPATYAAQKCQNPSPATKHPAITPDATAIAIAEVFPAFASGFAGAGRIKYGHGGNSFK
jgi:hypothetical protein